MNPVNDFPVFIFIQHHILWRRNEAMFYTAVAAYLVLVSARMKKTYIQWFAVFNLWQKHFVDVFFGIVVIVAVAGNAAQGYTLVFGIPFIYGQHQEFFANAPCIGQSGDEG